MGNLDRIVKQTFGTNKMGLHPRQIERIINSKVESVLKQLFETEGSTRITSITVDPVTRKLVIKYDDEVE